MKLDMAYFDIQLLRLKSIHDMDSAGATAILHQIARDAAAAQRVKCGTNVCLDQCGGCVGCSAILEIPLGKE